MRFCFNRLIALCIVNGIAMYSAPSLAKEERVQLIVANKTSSATTLTTLYPHSVSGVWTAGPTLNSSAASTQKTIGASSARQSIMYKKSDGLTYIVDGQIAYGNGAWSANFDGLAESVIFTDQTFATPFKFVPEEIEIEPNTNDVFALVNGIGGKQIYRVKTSNGHPVATLIKVQTSTGAFTNRIFANPSINGYKSGSITFVPKPGGGGVQYLVFTHQSNHYGICHWVYEVKTGANENELWSISPSVNKCGALPGFGTAVNGINTTYVGETTAANGSVIPPKFLLARNSGQIFEVANVLTPVPTTGWAATVLVTDPPVPPAMSNDFAWYRNFQ